jgi:hypothetical protein
MRDDGDILGGAAAPVLRTAAPAGGGGPGTLVLYALLAVGAGFALLRARDALRRWQEARLRKSVPLLALARARTD